MNAIYPVAPPDVAPTSMNPTDMPPTNGPRLVPGSTHFQVIEEPQYAASGAGEHLYVEIEKEGYTTDLLAEALAKTCGKRGVDIGYAGRKDRHAVTRQWFSIHFGDEKKLLGLADHLPANGRVEVKTISRHANPRWPS